MACRRCGSNKNRGRYVPPKPKPAPPKPGTKRGAVPQPPKPQPRQRKFCTCGWMMARTRYVDVNTNEWVEKYSCPNHQCPQYNK